MNNHKPYKNESSPKECRFYAWLLNVRYMSTR